MPATDLLDALCAADSETWEAVYAASPAPLTLDEVHAALVEEHPSARWLALRIHAGPPGRALPEFDEAVDRFARRDAGIADAYALVFGSGALTPDVAAAAHRVLHDAAVVGWRDAGGNVLTCVLATLAALAAFVAGERELTEVWLDLFAQAPEPPPTWEQLAPLATLRRHPELYAAPAARQVFHGVWPAAPLVPTLPVPDVESTFMERSAWAEAVFALGDEALTRVVARARIAWERRVAAELDDHPAVMALRSAARAGAASPPERDDWPADLGSWAMTAMGEQNLLSARLAGLAAYGADRMPANGLVVLCIGALRAADLPFLVEHGPDELATFARTIQALLDRVEGIDADDIVALLSPRHPGSAAAAERLGDHAAVLAQALDRDVPWQSELASHLEASPPGPDDRDTTAAIATLRAHLAALPPRPRWNPEVVRTASASAPKVPINVIERLTDPGETLVAALAARDADDGGDPRTQLRLTEIADHALARLAHPALLPLRIELLTVLLAASTAVSDRVSTATTLAGVLLATEQEPGEATEPAWALAETALDEATRSDDVDLEAVAVATWALVGLRRGSPAPADVIARIDAALLMPLARQARVLLLEARASVCAALVSTAPDRLAEAEQALLEALQALPDDDPFRAQLLRELGGLYEDVGDHERARAAYTTSLEYAPPDEPLEARARVFIALARTAADQPDERRAAVTEARRLAAGTDVEAESMFLQARCWMDEGREADALEVVRRCTSRPDRVPERARIDLWRLAFEVEARVGEPSRAAEARATAEALSAGTTHEAGTRLSAAAVLDGPEAALRAALTYVAGRLGSRTRTADEFAATVFRVHSVLLGPDALDSALAWARGLGDAETTVELLNTAGRTEEALGVIDAALAGVPSDERRRALLFARLESLGVHGEPSAIRATVQDIEAMGDLERLAFRQLHNLAHAHGVSAAGDPTRLERSLEVWAVAWSRCECDEERHRTASQWLTALHNRVLTTFPRSEPRLARLLTPFEPAAAVLSRGEMTVVRRLLAMLLAPGALTHPLVVDAAEALMAALPDALRDDRLVVRASSIRAAWTKPGSEVWSTPDDLRDTDQPEPATAPWFIEALRSPSPPPPPVALLEQPEAWVRFVQMRPDAADPIAGAAMRALSACGPDVQEALAHAFAAAVAMGTNGRDAWPALWDAVEAIGPGTPGCDHLRSELRRARLQPDVPDADRRAQGDAPGRFRRAVDHMHACRSASDEPSARRHRERAIELLHGLAEEQPCELHPADVLVSLGNALRLSPEPAHDDAIRCYEHASEEHESLPMPDPGKLHKVWCDALIQRDGGDTDRRAAWSHAEVALTHRRSGRLRAETLLSASRAAAQDPDRTAGRRAIDATRLLVEAIELAPGYLADLAPEVLGRLREAARLEAGGSTPPLAARLAAAWPDLAPDIAAAARGLSARAAGAPVMTERARREVAPMLTHPAGRAFLRLTPRLADRDVQASSREQVLSLLGPDASDDTRALAERSLQEHNLFDDPGGLRSLIEECGQGTPDEAAGLETIRAVATARLARLGQGEPEAVREATEAARAAVRAGDLPDAVAVSLLDQLAKVWSPADTVADPVTDFPYAVELAEEALSRAGGVEAAPRDVLVGLGRALRYRAASTGLVDYERARGLFERALDRDRGDGDPAMIANTLDMLSELIQSSGYGSPRERLDQAVELDREAVALARNPGMRARYATNLAWALGGLASLEDDPDRAAELFDEAHELFETYIPDLTDEAVRRNAWMNQQTVLASRTRQRVGHAEAIQASRERVEKAIHDALPDGHVATARHNLGDTLLRDPSPTPGMLDEAERAFRSALSARPPGRNHRQHWESAVGVAEVLVQRASTQGWREAARQEAIELLRAAARSAQELGRGHELHRCALDLLNCATISSALDTVDQTAEEAWGWMQEAMPYLLLDHGSSATEAQGAEQVTFRLAELASRAGPVGRSRGALVLPSAASARVLRWWRRAEGPWHRGLRARLEAPPDATYDDIRTLRVALSSGQRSAAARALRQIHAGAPTWLSEDGGFDATRAWLRSRRAMGVAVWPRKSGFMVAIVRPRGGGDQVAWIPMPGGLSLPDAHATADQVDDLETRAETLEALCGFVREFLAPSLLPLIGRPPAEVLWVPHGLLRTLPPRALFGAVPVTVAATLAITPPRGDRGRSRDAVVVLADPAEHPMGRSVLDQACTLADEAGPDTRLLAAQGDRSGTSLHARASSTPPNARGVMEALDHAGLAVIIAHGHYSGLDDAWLHLLREDGSEERLDVATLGADPSAISGLRVVLLACDAGRTGQVVHRPGGVAGALLAAGAHEVVAPMWSVTVKNAMRIGRALVTGHRSARSFSHVLAGLPSGADKPGPTLGRPSEARRAAALWDTASFVTRVG